MSEGESREWRCPECGRCASSNRRVVMIQCVNCGVLMHDGAGKSEEENREENLRDWLEQGVNRKVG